MIRYRRRFAAPLRHERWFGLRVLPNVVAGRFDAVHSMMPYDCLAACAASRIQPRRTVTLYDEMGIPFGWWWQAVPDGRARRRVARSVDVCACMPRYALDHLREEWGREGVLIPGGVRLDHFTPVGDREPVPTVLFSGALNEPRKGLATLLEAIALVSEEAPDVQLWLSGAGDPATTLLAAPTS